MICHSKSNSLVASRRSISSVPSHKIPVDRFHVLIRSWAWVLGSANCKATQACCQNEGADITGVLGPMTSRAPTGTTRSAGTSPSTMIDHIAPQCRTVHVPPRGVEPGDHGVGVLPGAEKGQHADLGGGAIAEDPQCPGAVGRVGGLAEVRLDRGRFRRRVILRRADPAAPLSPRLEGDRGSSCRIPTRCRATRSPGPEAAAHGRHRRHPTRGGAIGRGDPAASSCRPTAHPIRAADRRSSVSTVASCSSSVSKNSTISRSSSNLQGRRVWTDAWPTQPVIEASA